MPAVPIRLRLIQRAAAGPQNVLGVPFAASDLSDGLNGPGGFVSGQYERRLQQEGAFSLTLPSSPGADGWDHVQRFLSTTSDVSATGYELADEWIEVWEEDNCLYVGFPLQPAPSRTDFQIKGYDALWLLNKAREYDSGYWNHAPRDVWEFYTQVWKMVTGDDFQTVGMFPNTAAAAVYNTGDARFSGTWVETSPVPGNVRIAPTGTATIGRLRSTSTVPLGLGSAARYQSWRFRAVIRHPRFGVPSGDNAYVRVGMWDTVGNAAITYMELKQKSYSITGPNDTPGSTGPVTIPTKSTLDDSGEYELVVEGRERWVYFYVNQNLIGILPMSVLSFTASPYVELRTGDTTSFQHVDIDNWAFQQTQPFLMRSATHHGDYHFLSAVPGGLWGNYFDDGSLGAAAADQIPYNYAQRVFAPDRASYAQRVDAQLDFPNAAVGETGNGTAVPNWQPSGGPTKGLWWSARWTGSVFLDLAAHDYTFQFETNQEGARLWVGKTRRGEELIDTWLHPSDASIATPGGNATTSGSTPYVSTATIGMRAHIPPDPDTGLYPSGAWYPIVIEYGQRATEGAAFHLRYKVDAGAFVVIPGDQLSPYGVFYEHIQNDSFYQSLQTLLTTFGLQCTCEPMSLESGEFPGRVVPRARVGHDFAVVIDRLTSNNYGTQIDGSSQARAVMLQGKGLGADAAQLRAEAIRFDGAESSVFVLMDQEQSGDIGFGPLLAQRASSYLALSAQPFETITADPWEGGLRYTEYFPLGGGAATFDWGPGDAARVQLPEIGVVDGSPRQILGVQYNFAPGGRQAPSVTWRQRPRSWRVLLQQLQRRFLTKQRTYQGQYVRHTSTPGASPNAMVESALKPAHVSLPGNLRTVARAEVTLLETDASGQPNATTPWFIYVNGQRTSLPPVTQPGVYDITSYVANNVDGLGNPLPEMTVEFRLA